jgi:hypothetical protein
MFERNFHRARDSSIPQIRLANFNLPNKAIQKFKRLLRGYFELNYIPILIKPDPMDSRNLLGMERKTGRAQKNMGKLWKFKRVFHSQVETVGDFPNRVRDGILSPGT